jgi:hypothetical protein
MPQNNRVLIDLNIPVIGYNLAITAINPVVIAAKSRMIDQSYRM